ncbi:MAG: DUF134 domain-containing protein [Bacteroidota bacterium]
MPRPKRKRKIFSLPLAEGFKPFGVAINETDALELLYEEYEAIKLADYQNLTQEEAAKKMNISRPTFTRIYDKARKTIALALVEGKIIIIKGGDIHVDNEYRTSERSQTRYQMGIGGFCICLKCEIRLEHIKGHPCQTQKCPECGELMFRENSYHHLSLKKKQTPDQNND